MEGGQPPTADAYKEQVAMEKKKLYKQLLVMILLSFAVSAFFYGILFKAISIEKEAAPAAATLI
jgi:hypothetical protein